jgi:hypothetical protein
MAIDSGVIEEGTRCRCCGCWIKVGYIFCIPCARKRIKVMDDCLGSGMSHADAQRVVDKAYPMKFWP